MAIDPARPLLKQKALVTGGSSGIGEACALALGAAVVAGWSLPDSGYSAPVMAGLVVAYLVVALIYSRTPLRPPLATETPPAI